MSQQFNSGDEIIEEMERISNEIEREFIKLINKLSSKYKSQGTDCLSFNNGLINAQLFILTSGLHQFITYQGALDCLDTLRKNIDIYYRDDIEAIH